MSATSQKKITDSRLLRSAAYYIRVHGFDYRANWDGEARCFAGALFSVCDRLRIPLESRTGVFDLINEIVGNDLILREGEWTKRDCIAAFRIAADIAEFEEHLEATTGMISSRRIRQLRPPMICVKRLGRPSLYLEPDPYGSGYRR